MGRLEPERRFDPRAVLAALQRAEAAFVVIGGLARVIRGADEVTYGVDICPSPLKANHERVQAALDELGAEIVSDPTRAAGETGDQQPVIDFSTAAGPLKLVATPDGVPRGYDALRPGATSEHLGGGLRPQVACTADLITMASARALAQDLARIPELHRVLKLEASPARLVATAGVGYEPPAPGLDPPGPEL